jgi:excisionase family DNA binding protein
MPDWEIPLLEGFISVSETAERLNVSRQAVHKMVHTGKFTSARRVPSERRVTGAPSNEHIIIGEQEVREMVKNRAEQVVEPPDVDCAEAALAAAGAA